MKKILKNKKGFTLVELIVVIAILGILAVVMVPQFTKYIERANDANDQSAAKAYCTAYQAAYATAGGADKDNDDLTIADAMDELDVDISVVNFGKFTADITAGDGACEVTEATTPAPGF